MKTLSLGLLFICGIFINTAFASLICPHDVTLNCDADLNDLDNTGTPILFGGHIGFTPSYVDQELTTPCGVGTVIRSWYIDANSDGTLNAGEDYCLQTITLLDIEREIEFNVPNDVTIDCLEDIPSSTVTWIGGPCDFIGYDSEDIPFEISSDACYKILRKHTLIDWCVYAPHDPNWNGEGLYEFDQFIKVIDNEAPVFDKCADEEFGVGVDCNVEVTLTNAANDLGNCPSSDLYWEVELDLWADGTLDYTFSYLATGLFKIDPTGNGQDVQIKIPELLNPGTHKVKWKVKDGCGNWRSCQYEFKTIDNKPPTPYCHQIVYASFDGSQGGFVDIPADMFNVGSFDNCTPQEHLNFAYSPDAENDTLRINCFNAGFQFLNVYTIDKNNNSDFCNVFLLIFDNGSCNSRLAPTGQITDAAGNAIPYARMDVNRPHENIGSYLSKADGTLDIKDVPLYEDITFMPSHSRLDRALIDIEDYLMMIDHLLYKNELTGLKVLAADLNDDQRITPNDLKHLKDFILGKTNTYNSNDWAFIPNHKIEDFDLRTYHQGLKITEFDGDLDFVAVMKGNISDQVLDSTISRSIKTITLYSGHAENGLIPFYSEEAMDIKGMQLTIEGSGQNSLTSDLFDVNNDDIYTTGTSSNIIHTQSLKVGKEEVLFYLPEGYDYHITGKAVNVQGEKVSLRSKEMVKASSLITFYPNPSNGLLNFSENVDGKITIYNLLGQPVWQRTVNGNQIDCSGLENGQYTILVESIRGIKSLPFIKVD